MATLDSGHANVVYTTFFQTAILFLYIIVGSHILAIVVTVVALGYLTGIHALADTSSRLMPTSAKRPNGQQALEEAATLKVYP